MNPTSETVLRRVRFQPYRKGRGPTFTLLTWDTGRTGWGKWLVGYRLTMLQDGRRTVLFQGEDFGCAPMDSIDSDAAVEGVMSFLTLRPGDTDDEYFADYTPEQLEYCSRHAEALSCEVERRFGRR